jgi:Na+/proline symporter
MSIYMLGAVVSFFVILAKIPGGWSHVAVVAGAAQKFTVFDFHFAPTLAFFSLRYTFWAGILGGCFLTTASHGTDQLMVQRLLSARDEAQSRTALLVSWFVIAFQFTIFLLIGVLLFVYYRDTGLTPPAKTDQIYPAFLWNNLPAGVAGLSVAAILAAAMANLSAALNALSSTTVIDFLRANRPGSGDAKSVRLARLWTIVWAAVLIGIGWASRHSPSVLEAGLSIASVPLGALLGVFLLGVLTKKPGEIAAITGVIAGMGAILFVYYRTPIAFTWYVLIGTSVTFLVGLGAAVFDRKSES